MNLLLPFSLGFNLKRKHKDFVIKAFVWFVVAAIVVTAAIAGAYYAGKHSGGDGGSRTYTANNYANQTTVKNDDDLLNGKNIVDNANQQAYQKIAELNAKLRSDLTEYDITETGATGDLWAKVYGPQKIYGFSAFPIQVKVYTKESNIQFNVVHLRTITIYLKDENGNVFWTRTWSYGTDGSEGLNGDSAVYSTILKVPDDYQYLVKQAIQSGSISKELIQQLFNASTRTWEINVDIDAYRESWQNDPSITNPDQCNDNTHRWDSNTNTCYVFVRNIDINYHIETTSAWRHVTRANDVALLDEGMYASLPIKFVKTDTASKWVLYQEKFVGALSNFIILSYANPVHVMGSTADYKFYIAPNPGYFDPLSPQFQDDFRFIAVRVYKDGHYETADTIQGTLGSLSDSSSVEKLLTARYTADNETLTYRVFGMAYFELIRDDGTKIPIWLVAEPDISVQQNERVVLDDTQIEQLVQFTEDNKLTEDETQQIRATISTLISGLNEKITKAEQLKNKATGLDNDKAEFYAKKAIDAYNGAKDALEKAKATEDTQMFLNWLNVAKKLEQAGDFYSNAANKELYGESEQAELDVKAAEDLTNIANEYKPSFNISALLNGNLPFGLTWMDIIVLTIAGIAAWVGRQFLGPIGTLLGLVVAVGWFSGKFVGEHLLGALVDKLKFW